MKQTVCDFCGKVINNPNKDYIEYMLPFNQQKLTEEREKDLIRVSYSSIVKPTKVDLCKECSNKLWTLISKEFLESKNGI